MSNPAPTKISIPSALLPSDGRFGSGPSKIRDAQIDALVAAGKNILGTSHRQPPVKNLLGSVRDQLSQLFSLPQDWEVVFGNGGASTFWDVATFGLIDKRSEHLVFGEFSSKFADAARKAPHLQEPVVVDAPPGTVAEVELADVDTYCFTHNETSTGATMPLVRPATPQDALVVVDATSAAGGITWSTSEVDVYYFSPQKGFGSEGGTWIALCSPRAVERINSIAATKRWCPTSLDLSVAAPFVHNPAYRSPVVGTIDIDGIDASAVNAALRENGIVDTDSYRKLGRNQLRVSMFPSVEPTDILQLTKCIDYIVEQLS